MVAMMVACLVGKLVEMTALLKAEKKAAMLVDVTVAYWGFD